MILNTGSRTDIPAFYAEWFYNRVKAGEVLVRNPYNLNAVTRYRLDPKVVDVLVFCTKNPAPMLPRIRELDAYRQLWHVTITPYGKDIEPGVPDKHEVLASFRELAKAVGKDHVVWRYDPIFLSDRYTMDYHFRAFETMASELEGYTSQVIFSFIDLYQKTKKNFPEVREVYEPEQDAMTETLVSMAGQHGMQLIACLEDTRFAKYGVDASGCMTKEKVENAFDIRLDIPKNKVQTREGCACLLGGDIGMYNTCSHFCRYCYANYDRETVLQNRALHDPESPFLIGGPHPADVIHDADQESWLDPQIALF
ncbi:MAG: DUF1848 family protein [Clostridia bacterium]|nr:DUF1848 family protein [Clostridia bacterium]MBR1704434.1 DUF1848 family protein [Clostridia bacterium]